MSITFEQKTHVIDLLKKKYADWDGFEHQAFRRDEINFKRSTVKKAVSLLSESTLAQLLVTRDTNGFIERLVRIGRATPLLERNGSANGDLEILYVSTLDKPVFCAQVYHLLHGTESVIDRLDAYFQYVEDHELPNTWTFPTYLLQFCYPDSEIFVETRPTEWFLKYIGLAPKLGRPSAETYSAIKEFARELKISLAEYRPKDMIDIQSVIHVCSAMAEPAIHAASNGYSDEDGYYDMDDADYGYDDGYGENFWAESQQLDNDPTMLYISDVTDESDAQLQGSTQDGELDRDTPPHDVGYSELHDQFKVFLNTYMSSPAGVSRAAAYAKARETAELNFSHLIAEHELGETVTDRVFLHLLPHADTDENQRRGAWVHPVLSAENLIDRLDQKYGSDSSVREQVAQVLLEFIRHCVYKANALEKSTEALERIDAISLIDIGSITPILHALKPMQYVLLHDHSVPVINYYSGTEIHSRLQKLPEMNASALQLVESLRRKGLTARFPSVQPTDLFDIFCNWQMEQQRQIADEPEMEPVAPPAAPQPASHREEYQMHRGDTDAYAYEEHDDEEEETLPQESISTPPSPPQPVNQVAVRANAYTRAQCALETGVPMETLDRWHVALARKRQMIFYGPAGTGKTFIASLFARSIVDGSDGFVQTIQFHPRYTYADFVGDASSQTGAFRAFCAKAAQRSGPCVMLIDEINRVNLPEVFGELLYQLEYRNAASLANENAFPVPDNVFVIGTMRPSKEAAMLLDPVVRRRFVLVPIEPDYEILKQFHEDTDFQVDGLVRTLLQLNERIDDPGQRIGISYFLNRDLVEHIEEVWRYEIEPCIQAAFPNEPETVDAFTWNKIRRRLTR